MKIFLDTASTEEVREAASWGVISGVTTNPTLIAKEGKDFHQVIRQLCSLVDGPVSAEVIGAEAPEMIKSLLEIRGVGIVDIRHLFGVSAVIDKKKIDLVIELFDWDASLECERVGLKEDKYRVLSVDLPFVKIPISSGRNVSAIIELACRNFILRRQGINTAVELEKRMQRSMREDMAE